MNKLSDLLKTLGLDRNVTAIRGLDGNFPVLTLDDGVEIAFKRVAKAKRVRKVEKPVETHTVAYFVYPSSDGGMPLSRRVIVQEDVGGHMGWIRGWETSNDSDYKFKKFLKRRIPGYQYHNESRFIHNHEDVISHEDRARIYDK